jgi:hypothetical protein
MLPVQAAEFLADPVKVTIGSADLSASHSVSQVRMTTNGQSVLQRRSDTCLPCAHIGPADYVECWQATSGHCNSHAASKLYNIGLICC